MPAVHDNIRAIERDIERIKALHSLRKITNETAKQEIRALEELLKGHVEQLPSHERQVYLIRKEFGKEF